MKAQQAGGSLVTRHYDKLALIVVLLILIVSASLLVARVGVEQRRLATQKPRPTQGKPAQPIDLTSYNRSLAELDEPFSLEAEKQRLVVGSLRVSCVKCGKPIEFNATDCPFLDCGAKQPIIVLEPDTDGGGISDVNEKKLGLNINDPTDERSDNDGDGFTNLEEFKAGTDINDAKISPPLAAKLRIVPRGVERIPFRMRFQGVQKSGTGVDKYQLNLRALERTHFAKIGEVIEGWKLESFEPAVPGKAATLVLTRAGNVKRLEQGKVYDDDSWQATLILLTDRSRYKVKREDTLKLPGAVYKVVDITETRVVIRDPGTGADTDIGYLTEEERNALQSGVGLTPSAVPRP